MNPDDQKLLRETYRLALENNRMLRKARRAAFVRTVVWIIIYAALVIAPIWFYMTYLDGSVQQLLKMYDQVEGTNQAESGYENLHNALQQVASHLPSFAGASSTPSQ